MDLLVLHLIQASGFVKKANFFRNKFVYLFTLHKLKTADVSWDISEYL